MSFTDDFLKELKKKNISITEQGPVGGGDSYTKSYLDGLNDLEEERKKRQELMAAVSSPMSSTMDDIGPVAKTIGESKPDLFGVDLFQKGVFEDGYQAGDIAKSILGTATDFTMNIGKGALGLVEGIGDFAMHGAAYGADLLGADKAADKLHAGANKNIVDNLTRGASAWVDQYSVLGGTTDKFAQGIGQVGVLMTPAGWASAAGAAAPVVTALTSGLMFASSAGSGISEAYQGDATDLEALKHGLNSGAADAISELIFGGMGKAVNALGFSKGLSSADDMLAKLASSKLKNQAAKNIVEFGIKSGAEGLEEVVAGIAQAYSKHNTYMSEKDFTDILADENLLEQFVVGAMTSGAMQSGAIPGTYQGSLIEANKQGKDFITGQTVNEQAVIKKEIEKRIAEQEKDGRKLTAREKSAIEAQVEADLPKGYISTDTIEEVLGGDDFKAYKDTIDSEEALKQQEKDLTDEYNLLNKKKLGDMTGEETDRRDSLKTQIAELQAKIKDTETNSKRDLLKAELSKKVYELSKSDRLVESYLEPVRAKQKFTADLSKYEGKAKEVIKQVMDSGLEVNSNAAHDFWDMAAKVSADTGISISLANNQQIMEMVKAEYEAAGVEFDESQFKGQTIDGYKSKNGIVLNAESKRALNWVVGHEITHTMEKSKHYGDLQAILKEYAAKEYDSRFKKRMAQYKGKYNDATLNDDVAMEVTADMVGDFLFTDQNFVNHLSTKNRNVFQKMFDEIKYLLKQATAGSKEARELERVKHLFEKAYKDSATKNTTEDGGVKYSLESVDGTDYVRAEKNIFVKEDGTVATEREVFNSLVGKTIHLADGDVKIVKRLPDMAMYNELVRRWPKNLNEVDNAKQLNKSVNYNMEELLANSEMKDPDLPDTDGRHQKQGITGFDTRTVKFYDGDRAYDIEFSIAALQNGEKVAYAKRFFGYDAELTKKIQTAEGRSEESPFNQQSVFDNTVPQNGNDVKLSLSDSEGRQLSKEQQDYFKDSKVRDADGNLKVMYHGTTRGGFHTFDPDYSDDGTSLFFVDSNDVASSYSGTSETYAARTFRTAEDFNNFFAEIGATEYSVTMDGHWFELREDGTVVATSETAKMLYDEFRDWSGLGEGDVNYKVYLNLTNPLEVDADGSDWNALPNVSGDAMQYEYIKMVEVGDDGKVTIEYSMMGDAAPVTERVDLYKKFDDGLADTLSNMGPGEVLEGAYANPSTTREYAQYAKENGYDGVIFKNIYDIGGYGSNGATEATVAIAFDSNQVKSIANDKPTANPDIRFSLSEETDKSYLDAVNRGDTETAQKMVDDAAKAAGYTTKAYHGTYADFFTFDKDRVGKGTDQYGAGFYFASDKTAAGHYGTRVIDSALKIENPFYISSVNLLDAEITLTDEQAYEIVKRHPKIYDPEESPLGDYYDSYWEDGPEDWMVEDLAMQYTDLGYLDSDLFRDYPNELHEAVRDVTGHDGIVVNLQNGERFYIAWFDNQMKAADPATYDDNGNLIPLSERFNTETNDIRHSISDVGEEHPVYGSYHYYSRYKPTDIAPVQETAQDILPDDYAPMTEEETAARQSEILDSLTDADMPAEVETEYLEMADAIPLTQKVVKDIAKSVKGMLGLSNNQVGEVYSIVLDYSGREFPSREALFNEVAERFGQYTEKGVDEDLKAIKAELRTARVNVDDAIKGDITDYGQFKKRNFGKIRFSNEGLPVDVVYMELAEKYPGYFPEDIINPSEQLQRMAEIASYDHNTEQVYELDDEMLLGVTDSIINAVNEFKASKRAAFAQKTARESFNALMPVADEYAPPMEDDIGPVAAPVAQTPVAQAPVVQEAPVANQPIKTVKERLAAKLQNYKTELANAKALRDQSNADYDSEIERLQAEYDAKPNKNTVAANNILLRIERMRRMKGNVDADYAKRISDMEAKVAKVKEEIRTGESKAEQGAMRRELHQGIIDKIKTVFEENGFDLYTVMKNAKNLSTFATVDNTPQRVNEKTFGYKAGQLMNDLTVNQVARNETEGIKWLNQYTDRKNGLLKKISDRYNIKPGTDKSAAAQMYAEGFYVAENGDIIEYGDAELAKDFPNAQDQADIKGLAREPLIRQIYDETLALINATREANAYPAIQRLENYFLHFRAMGDTFSKWGLPFNPNDIKAKDLPTDLNGVTADLKPGQPYFASAMHRKGQRTSFDLLGGLEMYLTSAMPQIYHIGDIQTHRALRNFIADTFGQANGLEGLDNMTEEEAQERIEQVYGSHLSTYAKFLNEEANVLAGKTALIDRGLEGIIGRRGMTFLDTVNRQVGANMVGYNVSSSLTNFLAPVQAFAKTNKADFVKAFSQTVYNKLASINGNGDGFAEQSPVMIRRKGADRFHRTFWQKLSDPGYALMGAVDSFSTELIARAKYNEFTRKGMDAAQAHIEADKWTSRLMGDRSLGQQPHLYNSKMLGIVTKFQLEVRNQLDSQFYDTIQEAKVSNEDIQNAQERNAKTAAKVASTFFQLAVGQHLFGKAFESIAGYNPAFDIIEALVKAFGWDDDEEDEDTVLDNIGQGFMSLMEDMPYSSVLTGGRIPIQSALPISEFFKGKDQYGNEKSRLETLSEAAPYYLLPGGYGQIKKTVAGLNMFSDEHPVAGSYTDSGNLRFPVEDTLLNRAQAAVFGQYASSNARDYFDNERQSLKKNQIQEFVDVDIPIRDYWAYRDGLKKQETLEDKFDYIAGLDLPISKKNILINNVVDRKEPVDLSDYDAYSGYEEFDFATKNPEKYAFFEEVGISYSTYKNGDDDTKDAYDWAYNNPDKYLLSKAAASDVVEYRRYAKDLYDIKADKDASGKTISGSRKEKVIQYINNLDIDYGERLILFKSEYEADDTYNADIVEYLNGRDDISFEEEVTILKELGFIVLPDGTVQW